MASILIIGAGSGIGQQAASQLLASPSPLLSASSELIRVIGASRSAEKLTAFAAKYPQTFRPITCDVTDESSVQALFEELKRDQVTLNGVVNCAGSVLLKPSHLTTFAEFTNTIAVNLSSCFLLLKYGVPLLSPSGASVVFFSTAAVAAHLANHDAIVAAKSGVEGFTRAAAATYAAKNIRINAIAPGLVKTPLTERIHANAGSVAASTAMHALGRLGEPSDIASLVTWLLSPSAAWMTGQVIGFDGGLSLRAK